MRQPVTEWRGDSISRAWWTGDGFLWARRWVKQSRPSTDGHVADYETYLEPTLVPLAGGRDGQGYVMSTGR